MITFTLEMLLSKSLAVSASFIASLGRFSLRKQKVCKPFS